MSMKQPALPYYTAFLMDKINKIYDAWDDDNQPLALRRALRLVTFLPKKMKTVLAEDVAEIEADMHQAYRMKGVDFHTNQLARNKTARSVATLYLEPFVDKLVDLLDEHDYLEAGGAHPLHETKKKLEV
jgi:hypothetical protein